jgi:hypothetical protein
MSSDLEVFIVERFLEFYNRETNTKFEIIEKKDEKIRDRPSYDYYCSDSVNAQEMAIEVKRLISKETGFEANLKNWFKKYVTDALNVRFNGIYFVVMSLYEFRESDFRSKRRRDFFEGIKDKIILNKDKGGLIELSSSPKIYLAKYSNEGSDLFLWLINFSSANENEVARVLERSLKKFSEDSDQSQINIILLLEKGTMCRRNDIADVIEGLIEEHDFTIIDEIYNLAIWRDTCIARVYPLNRIMESVFFSPESFFEESKFLRKCIGYFR